MTKSIVQTLLALWQAWCRHHFPGEPVPATDHPFSESQDLKDILRFYGSVTKNNTLYCFPLWIS